MVSIESVDHEGRRDIGAGFHIGNGYIATARHVVASVEITGCVAVQGKVAVRQILVHPDKTCDIAVLATDFALTSWQRRVSDQGHEEVHYVPLGFHLTDWIDNGFIMSKVLLMGYPTIAGSLRSELVAVSGEVNAIVDRRGDSQPHFIISPLPRGGFSGGPVISEFGFLLGVLTEEFTWETASGRSSFFAALTIEPLLEVLALNDIRPSGFDDLREEWSDFADHVLKSNFKRSSGEVE